MPLSIGQTLHNNRYRISGILGQGGMGAVYKAWDNNLHLVVAIKENQDTSPEAHKQFDREAKLLARLSHPNLPRVTDYLFIPNQGQYLVMDYVEGDDLAAMMKRMGSLPESQVLPWISQILDALDYLHNQERPIIHRDIKPDNIKITPTGKAMLVDFGIAKVYDPSLSTTIGARAITPGYSPPEQYGSGRTDERSDIYALGATLYHLLTGQKLPESVQILTKFQPLTPPRQINPRISQVTESAILRCIEVDTSKRPQTARELKVILNAPMRGTRTYLAGTDTQSTDGTHSEPYPAVSSGRGAPASQEWIKPVLIGLTGFALVTILIVLYLIIRANGGTTPEEERPTFTEPGKHVTDTISLTMSITPTLTRTPTYAQSPTETPATVNYTPIFQGITSEREGFRDGDYWIDKYIHFSDQSGDADRVIYTIVDIQPEISGVSVSPDYIDADQSSQISGTRVMASWRCGRGGYMITLRAQIVDRDGNYSDPFEISFNCPQLSD